MANINVVLFTTTSRPCRYIITALLATSDCPNIRIIASPGGNINESFPPLRETPHSITLVDNIESPEFWSAFQGVDVVFHDGVPLNPNEEVIAATVVDAAKAAGVKHFILLSVLHPMQTKSHSLMTEIGVEEYLLESRLNYTILQPPHYMQNIDLTVALETGKVLLGFSSSVPHGFIDLVDLAAVSINILKDPEKHHFARYEFVAENKSYDEVAKMISNLSGKEVKCKVMPGKEFLSMMNTTSEIKGEFTEDVVIRMMVDYDRWGLIGNPNILKWALNRQPTSWEDYLKRELQKLNSSS